MVRQALTAPDVVVLAQVRGAVEVEYGAAGPAGRRGREPEDGSGDLLGVATRLNGLWARIASPPGPFRPCAAMSVAMKPGAIDVTVMSWGASETAIDCPKACSPALLAP